jgi:TRAP-type C4-dicarboxylate transport system substrate-binding protein
VIRVAVAVAALTLATGQAAADPVLIRMANSVPANAHMNVQVFGPWCERVTAQSDGTVDAKLFPSDAIATSQNMWDRIQAGVVDVGFVNTSYYSGQFKRTSVTGLPLLTKESLPASIALWNMVQPGGALADEWKDVRPLGVFVYPSSGLVATVPIRRMEDLQGKKVGVGARAIGQWMQNLGAAPISLTYSQTYESLQRGLINAYTVGWTGVQPLKLWEVAKYYTAGKFGAASVVGIVMGKASYAKLADKGKAAVDANSGLKFTKELGAFWDRINDEGRKLVEQHKGTEIFDLTEAELSRWSKAADPVVADWEKDAPNGAKVLDEFKKQLAHAASM